MQLTLISLVKITRFLEFFYGISIIPITFLLSVGQPEIEVQDWLVSAPFIIFSSLLLATVNGALIEFLGYPIYRWCSNRVGIVHEGSVVLVRYNENDL